MANLHPNLRSFIKDYSENAAFLENLPAQMEMQFIYLCRFILSDYGFQAHLFEPRSYRNEGMDDKAFAGELRVFKGKDQKQLEIMVIVAMRERIFTTTQHCTFQQFMNLIDFLKSEIGQSRVTAELRRDKLARMGGPGYSAEIMAAITQLDMMKTDFNQKVKEHNLDCAVKVAELERQIAKLRTDCELKIEKAKADFLPASLYEPLSSKQLGKRCWDMAKARNDGIYQAGVPTNEQVRQAAAVYKEEVIRAHAKQFVEQDGNMELIRAWVESKILSFRKDGEIKAATRLAYTLEAMGGKVPYDIPFIEEEGNNGEDSGGGSVHLRSDDDVFNVDGGDAGGSTDPPEGTAGDSTPPGPKLRERKKKRDKSSGKRDRKGKGAKAPKKK